MADFMKVISGLTHCIRESEHIYDNPCGCCPYYVSVGFNQFRCESQQMKKDAIELLKEQHEKIEKAKLWLKASGVDLDAM